MPQGERSWPKKKRTHPERRRRKARAKNSKKDPVIRRKAHEQVPLQTI